jgi:predicted Zn-dependent protease
MAAIEKISRGVAQVQSMMQSSRLVEAQGQLSMLISDFPDVSVLHDLMGNVHYINKNLEMAYASYRKSLDLNPTNVDTQRMVSKIQGIIGIRMPAAGGGK